jgi:hypothetical protein
MGTHTGRIGAPVERPTSWWLAALRRRAVRMHDDYLADGPIEFESDAEREACIRFFNAAYRAEESGLTQAHQLADEVRAWDPELAECLVLYGNEEGWHRELLEGLLARLGGPADAKPRPMGPITSTFYRVYGSARHMETIMLTNLMFETIGSTTYRLALGRVRQPILKQMLTILARDESFHVPLNVHFIRQILARTGRLRRLKLRAVYQLVYWALVASSAASRRVAESFDHISFRELSTAYAENLGRLFLHQPDLGLQPPRALLALLGLDRTALVEAGDVDATSVAAAERAVDRENVTVAAL